MESNNKIKIGYSKDCLNRLKQFKTGNPDIVLVDTKVGTKQDESALHELCNKWHITNEWFEKNQEVLDIWNNYDPWFTKDFKKLKSEVQLYSSKFISALFFPSCPIFILNGFDSIKNKIEEAKQYNVLIPKEVEEYMEYAQNILDVYAINAYIQHPMFDLPDTIKWKKHYKLYNIVLTLPYRELVLLEHDKINKELEQIHITNTFEQFCFNHCSENLEQHKSEFIYLVDSLKNKIQELRTKVKRLNYVLNNLEKILSEE